MWVELNGGLKKNLPNIRHWLKSCTEVRRRAPVSLIPSPMRRGSELFWAHPRVLTAGIADAEPHICNRVLENLPENGSFFDFGDHYGWLCLNGARYIGRGGRLVAVEAPTALIEILAYHRRVSLLPQLLLIVGRNSLTLGRPGIARFRIRAAGLFRARNPETGYYLRENRLIPGNGCGRPFG